MAFVVFLCEWIEICVKDITPNGEKRQFKFQIPNSKNDHGQQQNIFITEVGRKNCPVQKGWKSHPGQAERLVEIGNGTPESLGVSKVEVVVFQRRICERQKKRGIRDDRP